MSNAHSSNGRRIVVGVDGSAPSESALRWVIRQARLTGARMDAVIAWRYPPTFADLLPPCDAGCPAGENIQTWLAQARNG